MENGLTREGRSTGVINGNANFPFVYTAHISQAEAAELDEHEEAINLKSYPGNKLEGYKYEALDPATKNEFTSSETARQLGELMSSYPRCFPIAVRDVTLYRMKVDAWWGGFGIVETKTEYKYSNTKGTHVKGDDVSRSLTVDLGEEFKIYVDTKSIMDNKRRMILVPATKAIKKDKLYPFINKRIYTINKDGNVQQQFDVTFKYPKSLIFAQGLGASSTDTVSNFEKGAILLYGRAFGVGKKNNDPDKTRYNALILDGNGALKYQGEFHYGSEKRSLEPYYAFEDKGEIFLFAKTVGSDNPGYAVLTFDDTGLIDTKEYPHQMFQSLVVGPYDQGLTSNFGRKFKPIEHFTLANGELLLYGEAYEEGFDTKTFLSHVFLRFDRQGNLLNHYVIPKEEGEKSATRLKRLYEENNRVYFVGEVQKPAHRYAIIIKMDYGSGEVKKTRMSDFDVFDLKGRVVYEYNELDKQLIVLGRSGDPEGHTIKSVVFELN